MLQRLPLEQFHGDEGAAFEIANIVNGANVWMIQRGCGAGFAAEALDGLRVLRNIVRKKFERHIAAEARVFGFVNHAHSAAAQFFEHGVMRDGEANHRTGGGVRHGRCSLLQRATKQAIAGPSRGGCFSPPAFRPSFFPAPLK